MKGIEIIAEKPGTRQKIHQRFFSNGERFIKHIPFSPEIVVQIKEQMKNKPVEIDINSQKWIRIKKTGRDIQMEEALSKELKISEPTLEDQTKIEVNMLKRMGFIVQVKEIEV